MMMVVVMKNEEKNEKKSPMRVYDRPGALQVPPPTIIFIASL